MIYLIGESHNDYKNKEDRDKEFEIFKKVFDVEEYYTESEFRSNILSDDGINYLFADPLIDHQRVKLIACIETVQDKLDIVKRLSDSKIGDNVIQQLQSVYDNVNNNFINFFSDGLTELGIEYQKKNLPVTQVERQRLESCVILANEIEELLADIKESNRKLLPGGNSFVFKMRKRFVVSKMETLLSKMHMLDMKLSGVQYPLSELSTKDKEINISREKAMIMHANNYSEQVSVVWKVGNSHVRSILDKNGPHKDIGINFVALTKEDIEKIILSEQKKLLNKDNETGKSTLDKKLIATTDVLSVVPSAIPVNDRSNTESVVRLKSSAPAPIPVPQLGAISKLTAIDDQTLVENKEAKVQVRESNSSKQKELIGENDSKISTHTVASLTSATSAALKPTLSEEKVAEIRAILSAPVTNVKSEALSKSSVVSVPKKLIESGNPKSIELRLVDLVREIRKATIVKMPQMYQKYKLLSDFSVQLSKSEQKALSDKIVKARNEMIFAVEKQYSINVIGRNKEQKKGNKAIDAKKNELEKELAKKQQIRTDLLEKAGDALELRSSEIKLQKQQLKADHGISEASDAKLKIAIDNSKGSKKGVVVKKSVDDVRNRKVDSDILAAAKNAMERRKKEDEKKKDKAIKKDIEKLFKEADRDRFWGDTGASATVEKMIENMVQKRFLGGATTKMDTALAKEIMKHMDTSDYMNKFEQEYGNKMEDVMDRRMDDYVSSSSMNSYMDQMADSYISYLDSKRMDDELSARFDSHMNSYLEDRWNAINDYMDERMQERCDEIGRFLSEHNESMNQALENRYNSIFGSASMDTSRALLPGLMNS